MTRWRVMENVGEFHCVSGTRLGLCDLGSRWKVPWNWCVFKQVPASKQHWSWYYLSISTKWFIYMCTQLLNCSVMCHVTKVFAPQIRPQADHTRALNACIVLYSIYCAGGEANVEDGKADTRAPSCTYATSTIPTDSPGCWCNQWTSYEEGLLHTKDQLHRWVTSFSDAFCALTLLQCGCVTAEIIKLLSGVCFRLKTSYFSTATSTSSLYLRT